MQDSYSEVTHRAWGGRLWDSLKGILLGVILILVALVLLWWNEGRAVDRARALAEGAGLVVTVAADRVDAANEGKLVHVSGRAETQQMLSDPEFGVQQRALKLQRVVLMYQWREQSRSETREKLGGGSETVTTYSYDQGWEARLIDAAGFKRPQGHANPERMPYAARQIQAEQVSLGAFQLSASLLAKIGGFRPVSLAEFSANETLRLPAGGQVSGDEIYVGQNPQSPQIGDVRIYFEAVYPQEISLVSSQSGESFVPYVASNGAQVELLDSGRRSAEQMFQSAQERNTLLTWGLRVAGFALMFVGFRMLLATLRVLAAVVPLLGRLVGGAIGLVSAILAGAISLLVIALAWFFYRPLLAGGLLLAAVLLLFGLKKIKTPAGSAPVTTSSPAP